MSDFFRWLTPGLRLKRWMAVAGFGIALIAVGTMFLALGLFGIHTTHARDAFPVSPYGLAAVLLLVGSGIVIFGGYRFYDRIEGILRRKDEFRGLAELAYQRSRLEQGPNIVCFGGGTGLSCLLSGIKEYSNSITAIVSVADDGGSSGRLSSEFDMLPPGDIRNCLIALADAGPVMADLMQYRFAEGELEGHAFGNLFITVLARIRGSFGFGIREANRILNVRGQVLPATLDRVTLVAAHPDGTKTTGQRLIARCDKPISELSLKPKPGDTPEDVLRAVDGAEMIVIGPGSLYTSILPNLLAEDLVRAIRSSGAHVILVVNTMEQEGETRGFAASDYLNAVRTHAPGIRVDSVLVNDYRPSASRLAPYEAQGIHLTEHDRGRMASMGVRVLLRDVIDCDDPVRHDPKKLAGALMEIYQLHVAPKK